jgi:hypothetical protein
MEKVDEFAGASVGANGWRRLLSGGRVSDEKREKRREPSEANHGSTVAEWTGEQERFLKARGWLKTTRFGRNPPKRGVTGLWDTFEDLCNSLICCYLWRMGASVFGTGLAIR